MVTDRIAITIDSREVMEDLTLHFELTGIKRFRMRVWIAVRLVKLAAKVLGTACDLKVDLR